MGEADFGTVDGAIARGFHDGEQVGIFRIKHYLIKSFLYPLLVSTISSRSVVVFIVVYSRKPH